MKYFDLSKININKKEFKEWNEEAIRLKSELDRCSSKKERKNFLTKYNHWTKIKDFLIEKYGALCWYSDCDLVGSFGDVDHFRPKSQSCDLNNNTILEEGYWWLAYDYKNYRLSCEKVNRKYRTGGKSNYFPLRNPPVITGNTVQLNQEEPVLLDPCNLNDTRLIGYREDGSIVCESSERWNIYRVNESARVYNLNEFADRRMGIIRTCAIWLSQFRISIGYDSNRELKKNVCEQIKEILNRRNPFSSIAFNYLMFLSDLPDNEKIRDVLQDTINSIYEE